jgi:hypothetical protein
MILFVRWIVRLFKKQKDQSLAVALPDWRTYS